MHGKGPGGLDRRALSRVATPTSGRHYVQEPAAALAVVDVVVLPELGHRCSRHGGEAAVANAVDNGNDGAPTGLREAVEPAPHLRRQVLLQFLDPRSQLADRLIDVDIEFLLLHGPAAFALIELAALSLQILDLEEDLQLMMHAAAFFLLCLLFE